MPRGSGFFYHPQVSRNLYLIPFKYLETLRSEAAENTWEARVREILKVVESYK
jgi:hypothetical protein